MQCGFGLHKYLCGVFFMMLKDGKSLCFTVPERLPKLFELNGLFPVQQTFKYDSDYLALCCLFSVARCGLTEACKSFFIIQVENNTAELPINM